MTPDLAAQRRAIRQLLDEGDPADAIAAYYAFHHPDERTAIWLEPSTPAQDRPTGFVLVARTGLDLFRPLVTMRLASPDPADSVGLIYRALPPGAAVMLLAPVDYEPLLRALFEVHGESRLRQLVLDPARFEPEINVLVTSAAASNDLPRFVIRQPRGAGGQLETVAAAGLNWLSPHFAEINVQTEPPFQRRGYGRAVVRALAGHLLAAGRRPLYLATEANEASRSLAQETGFVDIDAPLLLWDAVLRPPPAGAG